MQGENSQYYGPYFTDYYSLSFDRPISTMAMNHDSRPNTSYASGVPQSLPPITALTNDLPPSEPSPLLRRHHDDPTRDSGNFSLASQSKRKCISSK